MSDETRDAAPVPSGRPRRPTVPHHHHHHQHHHPNHQPPKRLSRILNLDDIKHVAGVADDAGNPVHADKALLTDRIYAKGIKRTLLQAQLFPPHKETGSKLSPFTLQPLVPPVAIDKTLVPRRPPEVVSPVVSPIVPSLHLAFSPTKAKPPSPTSASAPVMSPLSARDAYYIDSHRHPSVKKPKFVAPPMPIPTAKLTAETSWDPPTRAQLLHKSTQLKTFTESVEESILTAGVPKDSFLYLVRAEDNPYKLIVVDHAAIDVHDYYTMSRAGITHFCDGVPEFTYLETFEREHYMFSLVREIPFFQKYRVWKQFRMWKTNVRAAKTAICKRVLTQDLFILRPTLHGALMRLRTLAYNMGLLRVFSLDARRTYTLVEFSERQQLQMVDIEGKITDFVGRIVDTTYETCNAFLSNFLLSNGFATPEKLPANLSPILALMGQSAAADDDDDDEADNKPTTPVAHDTKAVWENGKPVTFTERAAMRTQCRKITKLIRLVEFVVVDSLLLLGVMSTHDLLDEMRRIAAVVRAEQAKKATATPTSATTGGPVKKMQLHAAPPAAPLFRVEVHLHLISDGPLHHSQLIFTPSCDELRAEMESVVFCGIKAATTRERLMGHAEFGPFVKPSIDELSNGELSAGLNLDMMVLEDARFQAMIHGIGDLITTSYDDMTRFTASLATFQAEYIENMAFCAAASNLHDPINMGRSIDDLREQLDKYTEQIARFDTLSDTAIVGLILADCRALNATLKPSPRHCMDALHVLIPTIAQHKNEELMLEVSAANDAISSIPTTVDEFAQALASLRDTQSRMNALDDRYMFLKMLYGLTDEYKIRVTDLESTNAFMLAQKRAQLKTSMDLLDTSTEVYTEKFAKELDKKIPKLTAQIQERFDELNDERLVAVSSDASDMLAILHSINDKLIELEATGAKYVGFQKTLGLVQSSFGEMELLRADLETKVQLWQTTKDWTMQSDAWRDATFADANVASIDEKVTVFFKTALTCERSLPGNSVVHALKEAVESFKETLPIVADLRCPALKERHWKELGEELQFDVLADPTLTLGRLVDMKLQEFAPSVNRIATEATQEKMLESMLHRIVVLWGDLEFDVKNHNDRKEVYVLGATDDIVSALEESLINMNTILGSRYVAPVRDEATTLHKRLVSFQETLDEWISCQREWIYLETIFSAPDIQRQLPQEAQMFAVVNTFWKDMMVKTHDVPNCMKATAMPGLCDTFVKHNNSLEKMRKSLEDYLETKRQAFPRFYFLSNDELLEILAHTKEPHAVQPHLCKLFDAIMRLEFGEAHGSIDILSMNSGEGERVPFGRNLKARGNIEDWLTAVQVNMKTSLHRSMKACLGDYDPAQRDSWIFHHPAQCVASVTYMVWAKECEAAFGVAGGMDKWHKLIVTQLGGLTRLIRSPLTKLQRCIVTSLVTTDVHARDIVEELHQFKVHATHDFNWKKQLRYMWDAELDDTVIQQSNVSIRYGYEYMGACSRLVITPLTDRCWMTITGAFDLKLGASPSGPAGTGKTETSKDLAKALAIQCIVFNCSDQIDYKIMAKLFCGLSQCGCWTCLDEFNRIDIEVLSVIAQQLMILRHGRLAGTEQLSFEGRTILLQDHHVIVTMNPGYAGRTELPDNLKICFRPVSMMVPDYSLIAEIMMFSEGFDSAKELSKKITKLYKLCSEQLSQQSHYDFGMRAVKTVLVMAGGMKRQHTNSSTSASGAAAVNEEVLLIRALREANLPKFVDDDLRLFQMIIRDLFPNVQLPEPQSNALEESIAQQVKSMGYQEVPALTRRTIELFETMQVRVGVALTGCSGSGKSTCYALLKKSMIDLREEKNSADRRFQKVTTSVLNPKCISLGELYGSFHPLTHEWKDGLASSLMRSIIVENTDGKTGQDKEVFPWLIFDGPIDALWIENLNTVLDDNMTLCLANGERIKLLPRMRLLFEVSDMNSASPASVSRVGVLYFSEKTLGWRPFIETWMTETFGTEMEPKYGSHKLRGRATKQIEALLECNWLYSFSLPLKMTFLSLLANGCDLFANLLNRTKWFSTAPSEKQLKCVDMIFVFSMAWAFGGNLFESDQRKFNEHFGAWLTENKGLFVPTILQVCGKGSGGPTSCIGTGSSRTMVCVFDFSIDFTELAWSHWENHVAPFAYVKYTPVFNIMVPTVDVTKYSHLYSLLVDGMKPVFLTGDTGAGKTVIAHSVLDNLAVTGDANGMGIIPVYVHFSAQTTSWTTQMSIENKLIKKRKTLLGAPVNKKVVVFADDINLPAADAYGTQACIELLRQLLDHKGLYDREKYFWKDVSDTVITAAAGHPGGGRQALSQRFMKHFTVFSLPAGNDDAMRVIFLAVVNGHLNSFSFSPAVRDSVVQMVEATITLYGEVTEALRPTPSKCHYLFNLRDVVKVFAGVLNVRPSFSVDTSVKLWMHECMRVFCDRLVNKTDRLWFTTTMVTLVNKYFRMGWTHDHIFGSDDSISVLFGCYGTGQVKDYEEITDIESLEDLLNTFVDEYNSFHSAPLTLIFFRDTIMHISSMTRMLMQPRGNVMLIGVGGSGKRSLAKLAASIMGQDCFEIELTRTYGRNEFREDLKTLLTKTGVKGKDTMFLLTDTQLISEEFVEDINSLLNAGEIPNLFTHEETEAIINDMKPVLQQLAVEDTRQNAELLFVQRIRNHLHIVLCMSPVGTTFRYRCRQFPSLINCTTMDWYEEWPTSALMTVAESYLADVALASEASRKALANMFVHVHHSIGRYIALFFQVFQRHVYVTPKTYLDSIRLYLRMLMEKRQQAKEAFERLSTGVIKLEDTNRIVAALQIELTNLQPILAAKAIEAEELLKQVSIDQKEAAVVEQKVSHDEAIVKAQAAEVSIVQADALKDLETAMPALNAAVSALDSLDKKDITEVRSFTKPPQAVQVVMEAVCIMMGEKPDWDNSKRLLAKSTFMQELKDYDKDNISANILKKIRKYTESPDFAVDEVKKVSKAAMSLCMWIHAMDVYSKVIKEVGPKRDRLNQMNAILAEANGKLALKQAELNQVITRVQGLQAQCDHVMAEKKRLVSESELTKERLKRAEKLTVGLADELIRWKASMEKMISDELNLVGDVFLSAATISYLGPFDCTFRSRLTHLWLIECKEQLPCTLSFALLDTCCDSVQLRDWHLHGLPTDSVSGENAVMLFRGERWPLLIDPQQQAWNWIKRMEAPFSLEIVKIQDKQLLRCVETSVRDGHPLLIEDVQETLDPALDPLLLKALTKQGGKLVLRLGDKDVLYDRNFRLYMITKIPNPHYLPDICIKVNIINFTVTKEGLEDQLLGDVVRKEQPDIENKKNTLLASIANDQKILKSIESKILSLLSNSTGNILDDQVLINTLAESKQTSTMVSERLAESEITRAEISDIRNKYRSVSIRGSILYFVLADLAAVDPMYQYSLEYFSRLFNQSLEDCKTTNMAFEKRLELLIDSQTFLVYRNVCRGLFESHKLLFSFLLSIRISLEATSVSSMDLALLYPIVPTPSSHASDFISPKQFAIINTLASSCLAMEDLSDSMVQYSEDWAAWIQHDNPYRTDMPDNYDIKISSFLKLILVKALREDRGVVSASAFIAGCLGTQYTKSPPFLMSEVYPDLEKTVPCVFILSSGADPTSILHRFAQSMQKDNQLHAVSLGQGQGVVATALIDRCTRSGEWVLLQNCHLAKSWMPSLEKLLLKIRAEHSEVHDEFRLFLTSFPATYFPVSILQSSVKITNEPPKGLKPNLMRSYEMLITDDALSQCTKPAWKKLVFGLCFFHAILQERAKFGPMGWTLVYQFNDSDLETAISVLKTFLNENDHIPWEALHYVTGEINYGGRVTDEFDRRCLVTNLQRFYSTAILDEQSPKKYFTTTSQHYFAPNCDSAAQFRTFIELLPSHDAPDIFGLHENANIVYQTHETKKLFTTVMDLQSRGSSAIATTSAEDNGDAIVLQAAVDVEAKLPLVLDKSSAGEATFQDTQMDSLTTVLSQELVKFNVLIQVVQSSVAQLQLAVKGVVAMSESLDSTYKSLAFKQVPPEWHKVGFASLKPLASWLADFVERVEFLRTWLLQGRPSSFPLPYFYFPQGFLTGLLQNHARKHLLPINTLEFEFHIDPADLAVVDGAIVTGVYLEGGRWDETRKLLTNARPNEMLSALPAIHFLPHAYSANDPPKGEYYDCPVYKTTARRGSMSTTGISTNYIISVHVPCEFSSAYWVLNGTALICNLNE
ncbi:Aste57867_966 [Aphanomyces stellatus]|uniref:Aste57867_966 protein n=1 Tax=Aphanomyces stellatus TaxID=120398 RepID=A0A485K792_9STRA|nr:hypothetical protein As57867_000965 [Aphanomyces stellatus]VFT78188.1 Aste57867_966 [Aphanomyces stellatus]